MKRYALATCTTLLLAFAISTATNAADYTVKCPSGTIIEYQPKVGLGGEVLSNLTPEIVGVTCSNNHGEKHVMRGLNDFQFNSPADMMSFVDKAKQMLIGKDNVIVSASSLGKAGNLGQQK